ncbi:unnamed protein product [Sphagnum jensenii]|uniref:OCEL domain-containing protein n=1 Tax=Sphagnum jensenii TaxID=128206 RepID=A0ABP1BHX9_9BRYO
MSGSKLGRGTGRGTGRMMVAPPPPLGRGMPMRRQGMGPKQKGTGVGKGRLGSAGGSGAAFVAPSQEESFQVLSLDQGRPPFAMAIRLTPEVLEDLKRAETEDVKCEMKFGVTPAGHVIKVGDEEYKFSSAPEPGDLCDIYEEQQRGEDGNGVLKEAGSVWRKLSVLRILNASEKDRVKNRSKEAERQQKSRKYVFSIHHIIGQKSIQNGHMCAALFLAFAHFSSAPVVPIAKPKPAPTTAAMLATARAAKAASVTSPELLPPIRPQTAILPPSKGRPAVEEGDSVPVPVKTSIVAQNNNTPSPATTTSDTGVAPKAGGVVSPSELRNCLITLLTDNPKGLTIKAVEKALGEAMPHVKPERKTIEKAIKAIASYHAPGKYMLKEGVSFAKPSPGSGRCPVTESMPSYKPESLNMKEQSLHLHESSADVELVSIRGDENTEQDLMESGGPLNQNSEGGKGLAMGFPKGEEKLVNSGGSDTSSCSDSGSDSDSESHSGSESHSCTRSAHAFGNGSRSGSGSDSDSDGSSSSGNEDANMDEDVEIMSEDEEKGAAASEDSLHLKPKTKDKKQASRQAKEKRSKFRVSDKIPIPHDSEEVDVVGEEATGQVGTDSGGRANVVVEVLDSNLEVDVDAVSVDGGVGSPQDSVSPPGLQREHKENEEIQGSEDAKSNMKLVSMDKSCSDSDESLGAPATKQNDAQGLQQKKNDIESRVGLVKGGVSNWAENDSSFAKAGETEKGKASNLRADMAPRSILGSPALKNDGRETISQQGKGKRHATAEFHKSLTKDAEAAVKTVRDPETGELIEKIQKTVGQKSVGDKNFGTPKKPLQRSIKGGEKANLLPKLPVEMPLPDVSRNTEVSSTTLKEAEPVPMAGRETDAEVLTKSERELESTMRLPRELNWRNNPDAGLLGKPGKDVEFLGNRHLKRDLDPQSMYGNNEGGFMVRPGRDPKQVRRQSLEPEVSRWNESLKETDAWGKVTKDPYMAARFRNDGGAQNSWFRDGRKMEPVRQETAKGMSKIDNGSLSKQNEKRGTESPDLELGELRESTTVETWDLTRKDGTRPEAVKGREIVEPATSNKSLVHKGQVSPPKDKARSAGKAADDLRKASPATAETRKPTLPAQKEVQRIDQVAARETTRTTTGVLKPPGSTPQEERLDAGSVLKSRVGHSEGSERPQESKGVKRSAEDSGIQEAAARVYKKPSVAPVIPLLPVNGGGHPNVVPASKLEKISGAQDIGPRPTNAELNRGTPLDVPLNNVGPSSKASSTENGQKQHLYVKGQEAPEKEGFERRGGQDSDRKPKTSASVVGPDDKTSALFSAGQSNGKWAAKLSGSCDVADEKDYFRMYEKTTPELRGPVVTYEQAEKYKREYEEKYIIYHRLHEDIEDTKLKFAGFKKEIEFASNAPEKLQQVHSKIQKTYHAVCKRSKRMQKTFDMLHDELLTIKQHLKDFAEKAGQG